MDREVEDREATAAGWASEALGWAAAAAVVDMEMVDLGTAAGAWAWEAVEAAALAF